MAAQDIPHQNEWCPGAQQQFSPPPANALPFQIVGVQRRKEPRLLASAKASGTTRRIYLGAARWTDPPLGRSQGLGAWSSLIRCPHSLDQRALQLCALEPRGSAWGCSTPSLRPGAICGGVGVGDVSPTAASAPSLSSNQFGPLSTHLALGNFPLLCTQASLWGPGTPFPPCG